MGIQSDLFDKFVTFAGRNTKKKNKLSLTPGSVVETVHGDFVIMQVSQSSSRGSNQIDVNLRRVINGKVDNG